MSTRQRGVKHSITKRRTPGLDWEVRLRRVAGPRRVRTPRTVLSSQVVPGVTGVHPPWCNGSSTWLKTYGRVRANRSALRCTKSAPPDRPRAPLSPLPGNVSRGAPGARRAAPLRPAQQQPADPGHRGQYRCHPHHAARRRPVDHQDHRGEDAAEGGPADGGAHRGRSGTPCRRGGRGRAGRAGCGAGPGEAAWGPGARAGGSRCPRAAFRRPCGRGAGEEGGAVRAGDVGDGHEGLPGWAGTPVQRAARARVTAGRRGLGRPGDPVSPGRRGPSGRCDRGAARACSVQRAARRWRPEGLHRAGSGPSGSFRRAVRAGP